MASEVSGAFRAMGAAFREGGSDITSSGLAGFFEQVGLWARQLSDTFQTTMMPALAGAAAVVRDQLLPAYMTVASAIANGFMPVLRTVGSIIMDTVVPAVMRIYAAIYENVQPIITAFASAITTYVAPAIQRMGEKLSEVYQKAQPVISVVVLVTEKVAEFAAKVLGVVIPPILRFAGEVLGNLLGRQFRPVRGRCCRGRGPVRRRRQAVLW
jgi:phage-related protein